MNLYEIDEAIMGCVDLDTGEILDVEKLESLEIERDTKVENMALWLKNLKAEAEALKAEKIAFEARQRSVNRLIESVTSYMSGYLNGTKFKTTKVDVSFRKSTVVEVSDIWKIPDDYLNYKEPEVKKNELKKAIKEGMFCEGAKLVIKNNMVIK